MKFKTVAAVVLFSVITASTAFCAGANQKLSSNSGFLLQGSVYKQSGAIRSGIITIHTSWKLPAIAPTYRYDFDILYGNTEGNLYSFMLSDIAQIEFLPIEDDRQPVNILLRNGAMQKVTMSSKKEGIIGTMNLQLKEVDVFTRYGENIISGGDVQKIVFSAPPKVQDESLDDVISSLGKTLHAGAKDGLVDKKFMTVLEKIYSRLEVKAAEKNGNK
ncbi:MAG: hypothetical protein ACYDFU_09680 [Nitrospirota bacterium]